MPLPDGKLKIRFNKSRSILLSLLLCFIWLCACACSKQQIVVPAAAPEPTNLHLSGKFIWFDLFTQDLESAARFYEGVFGWQFDDTSPANKTVKTIFRDGVPIANAIQIDPEKHNVNQSRWLSYMSTPDVDQTVALLVQNNGSVHMPAKDLPDRGRVAVARDPQGAVFAIVTTGSGDPRDTGFSENQWMGSELWTTDVSAALDFYQKLAGYELNVVDVGRATKYHLLMGDGQPRAGIVKIPWEEIKPDWLPYVAVSSVAATVKKAAQMGGELLLEPDETAGEGLLAIISDPSGAVFAIQQLPE